MSEELKYGSKILVGKAVPDQNTILYVSVNNSRAALTTNILKAYSLISYRGLSQNCQSLNLLHHSVALP